MCNNFIILGNSGETFKSSNYGCLLESIEAKLLKGKYSGKEQCSGSNILRIALHSLDSPLWQYDFEKKSNQNYLYFYKFLYCLRSLIRNSYSACVITLPFRKFKVHHQI